MNKVRMSDGLEIAAFNKLEAAVLYHEIFETETYFKHGISLKDGEVVFDIGANIGMFSLYMAKNYHQLHIHSFEPVPDVYKLLHYNCSKQNANTSDFILHPYGLSDKNTSVEFQFSSILSMASGMYADKIDESNKKSGSVIQWLKAIVHDLYLIGKIGKATKNVLTTLLSIPLINFITCILLCIPLLVLLLRIKFDLKKVSCQLKTVHDVLKEYNIPIVHLAKIDVEGSESDVLNGIGETDWKKIKQLIIEVHNIEDRVQKLSTLLKDKGYSVVADQEDWHLHKLMNIYTIYATRGENQHDIE